MSNDAAILADIAAGGKPSDGPMDTFDTPVQRSPEQIQAELSKMKEVSGEIVDPAPELEKVSQTEKLDEEEVKEPEDKKPEPEIAKEEEKLPEEEKPAPVDVKTIRAKHGDKSLEIPEEATVKVTVRGKSEFKTVKELRDSYSGQQAWGEKLQEVSRKEKVAEQFYERTKAEKQELGSHIQKITGLLDDPTKDPLDALMYLVDLSGRNVHDYTKRVYDTLGKTVLDLESMDDVEKRLYWRERELSYLKNNHAAKESAAREAQTQRDRISQIEKLRESQGVSEDQYVEGHNDLVRLRTPKEQITPQVIVQYAAYKPYFDKADEICSQFDEDLPSEEVKELIGIVAEALKRNPKLSDRKALEIAAYQLGYELETEDTLADQVTRKAESAAAVRPKANPPQKKRNNDRPEAFGDYDEEFYGRR